MLGRIVNPGRARQAQVLIAAGDAGLRARPVVALMASAMLAGCSTPGDSSFTVFADPGKYQYYSCDQIVAQTKSWSTREQELRMLMDKADQSAGGPIVNLLAYRADHVAATEELKVLERTARGKNCKMPENWDSNAVIR